jgi:hypothetical protein
MMEGINQWARNSARINQVYWMEEIISVLNAPDSPDRIAGWSREEYFDFFNAPPSIQVPNDIFRDCIGSVDGTYIYIERPAQHESLYYSEYAGGHCLLFITVIDRYGRIRLIDTGTKPGGIKEKSAFGILVRSPMFDLPFQLRLLGDGAYTNLLTCVAPFSVKRLRAMDESILKEKMKVFNKRLRRYRVMVEWTFGIIKGNWHILSDVWRNDIGLLPRMFLCCCLLYNHLRRIRQNVNDALIPFNENRANELFPPRPDEGIID